MYKKQASKCWFNDGLIFIESSNTGRVYKIPYDEAIFEEVSQHYWVERGGSFFCNKNGTKVYLSAFDTSRVKLYTKCWIDEGFIKIKPSNSEDIFFTDKMDIFSLVDNRRWFACGYKGKYIQALIDGKKIYFHHLILKKSDFYDVDHINRNTFDNTVGNLRYKEHFINVFNSSKREDNTSGVRGVYLNIGKNKWIAEMTLKGNYYYFGYYDTIEEAAQARVEGERRILAEHGYDRDDIIRVKE